MPSTSRAGAVGIGDMWARVKLQARNEPVKRDVNPYGEESPPWRTYAEVWAEPIPTGSEETYKDRKHPATLPTTSWTFKIWSRDDVLQAHRIVWDGYVFNVESVRWGWRVMLLDCKESGQIEGEEQC